MKKYIIRGGNKLTGSVRVSGAKNVALKVLVAACLTDEEVIIDNIPLISDVLVMKEIIEDLGGEVKIDDHTARVHVKQFSKHKISLEQASHVRTSFMFLAPLLARNHEAIIPNPGGCRIGARPIDRMVDGLERMGAKIDYSSEDGYFHARAEKLYGKDYRFEKNTHTGTETLIIASVLAEGKTILENAAEEPEINELIELLNAMGAKVRRTKSRVIEIDGVERLHGAHFTIKPDRNEIVTFAIAAITTQGDVFVQGTKKENLKEFIDMLAFAGGGYEENDDGLRFYYKGPLKPTDVTTEPYPGFMTDWHAPWAVLMTQARGTSVIHETVFENKFGYASELRKMGAEIELFNPPVDDPKSFYNFNLDDNQEDFFHAARITGPTILHNAIVNISDLRAGATLVIAALAAQGESIIHGVHLIQRGYENFDERLRSLGADIHMVEEEDAL